jgi:hypothetical protein
MLNPINYTKANNKPKTLNEIKRNNFLMNSGIEIANTMKILGEI